MAKKASEGLIKPPTLTVLPDHFSESDYLQSNSRLASAFDIIRHFETTCPLTIALYGDWGTGKTTAMRWLKSELTTWSNQDTKDRQYKNLAGETCVHPSIETVWFEPWKYHDREDVWRGIISEVILSCIKVSNLNDENSEVRLRSAAKQFGRFLGRSFLHSLSSAKLKAKTPVADVEINTAFLEDIANDYQQTAHPEKAFLNEFETTLKSWVEQSLGSEGLSKDKAGKTVQHSGQRLCIFIDDLDRCLPEVTLEVLEALKLYLNIPHLIFVIGLDRSVVEQIVSKRYRDQGVSTEKASKYLDKMFQVEIDITPGESSVHDYLEHQIESLNNLANGIWKKHISEEHRALITPAIRSLAERNPREIKRLLNGALLRGHSAETASHLTKGENEQPRFAQGVQVFLFQHFIRNTYGREFSHILGIEEVSNWFQEISQYLIKNPEFDPRSFSAPEPEKSEQSEKKESSDSDLPKEWLALLKTSPRIPTFKREDDDLLITPTGFPKEALALLQIPFSSEIAQLHPSTKDLEPPTLPKETPPKNSPNFSGNSLDKLSTTLRNVISKKISKEASQLESQDLLQITSLSFSGYPSLNDNDLQGIGDLSQLTDLYLQNTSISDQGIQHFAPLSQLTDLSLRNTSISDQGIQHLAPLSQLKALYLQNTSISDQGIQHLAPLSQLKALYLQNTSISDQGIQHLAPLSQLTYLSLSDTSISDQGIQHLAPLSQLTYLSLSDTSISDQGIQHLAPLSQLKTLSLSNTSISDQGIQHLAPLSQLTDLYLQNTSISDQAKDDLKKSLPNTNLYF